MLKTRTTERTETVIECTKDEFTRTLADVTAEFVEALDGDATAVLFLSMFSAKIVAKLFNEGETK